MSVVNDIMENLVEALEGIRRAGGYNTDIKKCDRDPFDLAGLLESDTPALWINDLEDEKPFEAVEEDDGVTYQRQSIPVNLVGVIKRSSGLSDIFNDFIADIRKAIHAADLGTNVFALGFGEVYKDRGPEDIVFNVILHIDYYYSEASP